MYLIQSYLSLSVPSRFFSNIFKLVVMIYCEVAKFNDLTMLLTTSLELWEYFCMYNSSHVRQLWQPREQGTWWDRKVSWDHLLFLENWLIVRQQILKNQVTCAMPLFFSKRCYWNYITDVVNWNFYSLLLLLFLVVMILVLGCYRNWLLLLLFFIYFPISLEHSMTSMRSRAALLPHLFSFCFECHSCME